MIVVDAVEHTESDAASTNTLVTPESDRIPRHLMPLIYTSLIVSLLSFIFVLQDVALAEPVKGVATILAFVLLLPHHGAAVLLQWLHRHQTESIFPFNPSSPRSIAYSILLILLWTASTTVAGIQMNLYRTASWENYCPQSPYIDTQWLPCGVAKLSAHDYWPAIASTVTSATELLLITAIALVCWNHRRQKVVAERAPSSPTPSGSKVISA